MIGKGEKPIVSVQENKIGFWGELRTQMSNSEKGVKAVKAPLPKKVKWEISISVVLIVALLTEIAFYILYVTFGLFGGAGEKMGENISFGQTSEPDFEGSIDFLNPLFLPKNKQDRIEAAEKLYALANENTQKTDAFALSIKYSTCININLLGAKMSIPVVGLRYQLKNGTEYYATEYAMPEGEGVGVLAGWFAKESSMFASRSYVDIQKMDYMYSEKSYSPTFTVDETTGAVTIVSDFTSDNMVDTKKWAKEQAVPTFSVKQNKPYYVANRPMTKTNILDAEIEYIRSAEGNYYKVVLELDVDKKETWENTIEELRSGAGDDAKYDKMTETLEIWENGYYKRFHSLDLCSAKGGFMTFDFNFDTSFFYGENSLKPSSYDNFLDAKRLALQYNESKLTATQAA